MTVAAALEILCHAGTVRVSHGQIKLRFPEEKRGELRPAIDVLRNRKAEAMALLAAAQPPLAYLQSLRLKDHAVELWRKGDRYFVVADEEDADLTISRLNASATEVWTAQEIEIVAQIEDQGLRDEVQRFKRELSARVAQIRFDPRRKDPK